MKNPAINIAGFFRLYLTLSIYNSMTISCKGCGLCCMWQSQPPFAEDEIKPDIPIIPNPFNTPCCWLDLETKECKHYESRPKICQDFELGGRNCLEFIKIELLRKK